MILLGVFANFIAPFDPTEIHTEDSLQPPNDQYLFGTDILGRDILSRVIHGSQVSLSIGVAAVGLAVIFGIIVGAIGGYFSNWIDRVIGFTFDCILSFPLIILAILLIVAFGASTFNIIIALGIVLFPYYGRLMRGEALSVRTREYIDAAKALGYGDLWIIIRHVIPNSMHSVLIASSMSVGFIILIEASLSFIGLGTQPPTPSWGYDLQAGLGYMQFAPWVSLAPGLAIVITVFAFTMLGEGLREILSPRWQT